MQIGILSTNANAEMSKVIKFVYRYFCNVEIDKSVCTVTDISVNEI